MKCPRCGSKNVAEILYGMPYFDDKLQEKIDAGKIRLGGCCISGNDPKFYCNDCQKEFASPPVIITKDAVEDLRDITTSVYFSDGGLFMGHQDIRFEKKESRITLSLVSFPEYAEAKNEVITEQEWRRLLNKIFCQLCVHEWKKSYVDSDVLDGEQWKLQFELSGGRHLDYYGSNAYPPLWKELKNVFRPYFKKHGMNTNGDT